MTEEEKELKEKEEAAVVEANRLALKYQKTIIEVFLQWCERDEQLKEGVDDSIIGGTVYLPNVVQDFRDALHRYIQVK